MKVKANYSDIFGKFDPTDVPFCDRLLAARGIECVEDYYEPPAKYLESPLQLKNMGMAAALYLRIVNNNGHILIVVDSDNDGYTSAAIIYQYTRRLNPNCVVDYWLHEGKQHGLQDHIERLMQGDNTYDLIILPDSSSNDIHYHDMLDEIHLPCLILDHHLTDVNLSDNAVVVNNQLSPNYTNKELTGAGVVYQFCRYIDTKTGHDWADDYIDLAAWGIIGDMGSMLDMENRYIVYTGLRNIKNEFFKCLLNKQAYSITGSQTASWSDIVAKTNAISVSFYIVPMINALIRVGSMEEKELLFTAFIDGGRLVPCNKRGAKGTFERADIEAARVATNAKAHQNKIKETAVACMEQKIAKHDLLSNKVLFIRLEPEDKYPSELNGLIAMQLAARYKRPTIVARLNDEGYDRGSARGLSQSDLKDFKAFVLDSGLVEYAQGHANAFGVSIPDRQLSAFHEWANSQLSDIDFGSNSYDVDYVCNADEPAAMNAVITDIGNHRGIWGQGNPEPILYVPSIPFSPRDVVVMGASKDTIKIIHNGIPYIKFKASDFLSELRKYDDDAQLYLNIVGRGNLNEWMGRSTPQMMIDDYELTTA